MMRPRRNVSRWPRIVICFAIVGLLAIIVPSSALAAEGPITLMNDPADDVRYDAAYIGDQDHDYLDILWVFLTVDAANDTMSYVAHFADTTDLDPPPRDWAVSWELITEVSLNGEERGTLYLRVTNYETSEPVQAQAEFQPEDSSAEQRTPLPLEFDVRYAPNGSFRFTIPSPNLRDLGDTFGPFRQFATELFRPGGAPAAAPILNSDRADSPSGLRFNVTSAQVSVSGNQTETDGEPSPSAPPDRPGDEPTPAPAILPTSLALLVATVWIRWAKAGP